MNAPMPTSRRRANLVFVIVLVVWGSLWWYIRSVTTRPPKDLQRARELKAEGKRLHNSGQRQAAIETFSNAVSLCRNLIAQDRGDIEFDLADTLTSRGNVYYDTEQRHLARADYEEATRLYEELVGEGKDQFRPYLAGILINRSNVRRDAGQIDDAISDLERSLDLLEPATTDNALIRSKALANLARILAVDGTKADAKRALQFATTACELQNWKDCKTLDCLALAYAVNGDLEAAVKWQTEAVQYAPASSKAVFESTLQRYRKAAATAQGSNARTRAERKKVGPS